MASHKIYIGNISSRTSKKDIMRKFDEFGDIITCDLKDRYGFIEYGSSSAAKDAIRKMDGSELGGRSIMVQQSHGRGPLGGRRNDNDHSGYTSNRRSGDYDRRDERSGNGDRRAEPSGDHYRSNNRNYRVKIENLSSKVSWQDLKDFARKNIGSSVVRSDVRSDDKGNFGVLEFSDRGDYDYALQNLSGKELEGRQIEVARMTQDDDERSRPLVPSRRAPPSARGRYYDRSRSRSRSSRRRASRSRSSKSRGSYSSRSRSRSIPKEALEENKEKEIEAEEREKADKAEDRAGQRDGPGDGAREADRAKTEVEEAAGEKEPIGGEDGEVSETGEMR